MAAGRRASGTPTTVLGHGGFGTTLGALAAGVPQVVAPIFTSDQVINARHVAAAGVGRAVIPGPDVVVRACAEVLAVLSDPGYRARSRSARGGDRRATPAAAAIAVVRQVAAA